MALSLGYSRPLPTILQVSTPIHAQRYLPCLTPPVQARHGPPPRIDRKGHLQPRLGLSVTPQLLVGRKILDIPQQEMDFQGRSHFQGHSQTVAESDLTHQRRAVAPHQVLRLHIWPQRLGQESTVSHQFLPPSLCRLERLGLYSVSLGSDVPRKIGLFSPFQHTLSSLHLSDCYVTSSALVALINYFPLLADLKLLSIRWVVGGKPAPRLSRPLRGGLEIAYGRSEDRALFNQLSNPPPELDELVLHSVDAPFYDAALGIHGGRVKRLKMTERGIFTRRTSWSPLFPTLTRKTNLQ